MFENETLFQKFKGRGHFIDKWESRILCVLPHFLKKPFLNWRCIYHHADIPLFQSNNIVTAEKYPYLVEIWDNDEDDIFNNL